MTKSTKLSLWMVVSTIFFSFGYLLNHRLVSHFSTRHIVSNFNFHPDWEINKLSDEEEQQLQSILNQPFTYLRKGGQVYAFESKDGLYVLKFIKFKYLRDRFFERLISFIPYYEDWQIREMQRRHRKVYDLYQGYKAAFTFSKENSGLVYLHLNPSFNKFGIAVLYDERGVKHQIDLDQVAFIVQKKGRLLDAVLTERLDSGDLVGAQKSIGEIFDLIVDQNQNGFFDRDFGVVHNTGFIGEKPIHIDLGKMTCDEKMKEKMYYKPYLIKIASRIDRWIQNHYPHHHENLTRSIGKKLGLILDEEFQFNP